jgi:hypothetical protein
MKLLLAILVVQFAFRKVEGMASCRSECETDLHRRLYPSRTHGKLAIPASQSYTRSFLRIENQNFVYSKPNSALK